MIKYEATAGKLFYFYKILLHCSTFFLCLHSEDKFNTFFHYVTYTQKVPIWNFASTPEC